MSTQALPTVSIHVVRAVFAEAIARGQPPAALSARFGVTPEELADPDARVTVAVMRRLWEELPSMLVTKLACQDRSAATNLAPAPGRGRPWPTEDTNDFGLAVARRAEEAGALHVVGYLARAAPTVGDALRLMLRHQRLIQDAVVSRWSVAGDATHVAWEERDPAWVLPRHAIEFGIASALLLTRRATGRPLAPRLVEVRHARPADAREARRVFGCEIRYGAEANVVTLASADLELPLLSADPQLAALLHRHASELEARLPVARSFTMEVRRVLADVLVNGDTALAHVAAKLRISPRTLQRRLHTEETSHQRVLDELRRDLAIRHLKENARAIQEIAFLLGFSDQSAFHHAFVRWTGVTPGAYRRASG